jgi:hypothetical protein
MKKIKCVISENGTIIPIHNISAIAGEDSSHYVWTNRDIEHIGYKLSDEQYNALLRELEFMVASRTPSTELFRLSHI